jgi:preprotein translocase subunit SecE
VEGTTAVVIFAVFAFAAYFAVVDKLMSMWISGILKFFTK